MAIEEEVSALSYEEDGSVGIWRIHDFEALFEDQMERGETWYERKSGHDKIMATVVVLDGAPNLSGEVQEYINEVWSHFAEIVDLEKVGYVGDGIAAMAVKSNVEVPGTEIEDFEHLDEAIAWAKA